VREESLDRLAGDSPDWTDRGTADGNSVQPDSDFGELLKMTNSVSSSKSALFSCKETPNNLWIIMQLV